MFVRYLRQMMRLMLLFAIVLTVLSLEDSSRLQGLSKTCLNRVQANNDVL